jgi:CRAL/TRIO, N-terminal domain/CRAL/TRIO domain
MSYFFPGFSKSVSKYQSILFKRFHPYSLSSCKRTFGPVGKGSVQPYFGFSPRHSSEFSTIYRSRSVLKSSRKSGIKRPLQSGVSSTSVISGCILLLLTLSIGYTITQRPNTSTKHQPIQDITPPIMAKLLPGRPENLTPEQEAKLREMWILNARLFGFLTDSSTAAQSATDSPESTLKKTTSRFGGFFRSSTRDQPTSDAFEASIAQEVAAAGSSGNDKFGQSQLFKDAMAKSSPQELRDAFWAMVKHDHPDALLLRFLRARKWDVHAAEVMAISALHWRIADSKVDSEIMLRGEAGMFDASLDSEDAKEKQLGSDFINQFKRGKSFVKGVDKEGRPLCYIRVRKHRVGDFSEESLERYTVYTIETARMMLRPPIDTAVSFKPPIII